MTTTFPAWAHGLQLELDPPKGPWPVWPDAEWVDAIIGSKLGAPDDLDLRHDGEDGLCFDFGYDLPDSSFSVVFSCQPKRRRGVFICERMAPVCWSPAEARALLDAIADGGGWVAPEEMLASCVAPENRGKEPAPSVEMGKALDEGGGPAPDDHHTASAAALTLSSAKKLLADWDAEADDHDNDFASEEPTGHAANAWWDEGYRCGILSARVDLAEAIGVSDARKSCPRCSDCEGEPHHWMPHDAYGDDENEDGGNPEHAWACKHCDHTQAECPACGGDCVGECFDGCDDIEETPA